MDDSHQKPKRDPLIIMEIDSDMSDMPFVDSPCLSEVTGNG